MTATADEFAIASETATSPVRIYLDTSDYSAMYKAPADTEFAAIREQLRQALDVGDIEIGFSCITFFELIQPAAPAYHQDRVARARLLSEFSRGKVFPYYEDYKNGFRFPGDGCWFPRPDNLDVDVERLVAHLYIRASASPKLGKRVTTDIYRPEQFKRALLNRRDLNCWLDRLDWNFPYGETFVRKRELKQYLSGRMSRDQANARLRTYANDPLEFCLRLLRRRESIPSITRNLHHMAPQLQALAQRLGSQKELLLDERRMGREILKSDLPFQTEWLQGVKKSIDQAAEHLRSLASHEYLLGMVPQLADTFGIEGARVVAGVINAMRLEGRHVQAGDPGDLAHAAYLPDTDLWRGDGPFCDLLIKHKVPYAHRVVGSLVELPARIREKLNGPR